MASRVQKVKVHTEFMPPRGVYQERQLGCGWMKNESAMKIVMTKRKSGLYAQWYVVRGLDARGELCDFLIFSNHAKNYAQAVRFWEKMWGKTCTAFSLHNAEPFSDHILNAC